MSRPAKFKSCRSDHVLLVNAGLQPASPVAETVAALGEACRALADIAATLAAVANAFTGAGLLVPTAPAPPALSLIHI